MRPRLASNRRLGLAVLAMAGPMVLAFSEPSSTAAPVVEAGPVEPGPVDAPAEGPPSTDDAAVDPSSPPPSAPSPIIEASPADAPPPVEGEAGEEVTSPSTVETADSAKADGHPGSVLLDTVLPCGVRLLLAQDDTLPVAAVVLAVDTGSEDDPENLPGLTHALAYHLLLQGNRELRPYGHNSLVHDAGGIALLATGAGQIRFESVIPIPVLGEALSAESTRLRAPTVTISTWEDTLRWASRDAPRKRTASGRVLAGLFDEPGLAHDGRKVTTELLEVPLEQVGKELARRFLYERATLVVVSPSTPERTLSLIEPSFAGLPRRPHKAPAPPRPRAQRTTPRDIEVPEGDGRVFAWPIAPDPEAILWARVWCEALNAQPRLAGEPRNLRMRCVFDDDPRWPVLLVGIGGSRDPSGVLRDRLERLSDERDAQVLGAARRRIVEQTELTLDRPLWLARHLARLPAPAAARPAQPLAALEDATGLTALRGENPAPPLRFEDAARLVEPHTDAEPTDAGDGDADGDDQPHDDQPHDDQPHDDQPHDERQEDRENDEHDET